MKVFLMIARLLYEKGYCEYVEMARYIKARHPECRFLVVGGYDPDFPGHITDEVIRKDVESGAIEYLGFLDDVRDVIRNADCLVHPSFYNEGFSRVLMEAAALSCPVITTRIPGCREFVEEGDAGLLCMPKDVKSLCEAVETFLSLPESRRKEMGENGRRMVETRCDIRDVIDIYMSFTAGIEAVKPQAFMKDDNYPPHFKNR